MPLEGETAGVAFLGFLHIRAKPEVAYNVHEATEAMNWALRLTKNSPQPFLVNLSGAMKVSPKIFRYFSGRLSAEDAVALAIVTDSVLVASLGRFFWSIHQPAIPMRIYFTTSEAMSWLTGYRQLK